MIRKSVRILKYTALVLSLSIACSHALASISGTLEPPLPAISLETKTTPLEYWSSLAKTGSARAQFRLGELYEYGNQIPVNHTLAAEWYRRAADKGYTEAQFRLGLLYADGRGVNQSKTEAVRWLTIASEGSHSVAQNTLGLIYLQGVTSHIILPPNSHEQLILSQ